MLRKTIFALLLALSFTVTTVAQTAPTQQTKVNIIIDRESVRFAAQEAAAELRLVITDQSGAELYDSGSLPVTALDWPLRDNKGEAVKGGLYRYTLTVKDAAGELGERRGYLIINRAGDADQVYVATSEKVGVGAGNEAAQLTVAGSREGTVGGAELKGGAPRRDDGRERSPSPQRANDDAAAAKASSPAAPNGTANRVAKFDNDGVSLVDSAITETGGNVGIGTTTPQSGLDYRHSLAPFFTRDIGTTNFGGPQSALQLGVTNLGSRNVNVGPSFLFFGDNTAGAKSFLGRVSGVWENPTAGAEAGAILFQVRANNTDTGASTERMRITAAGNVGIGTTTPEFKLDVVGNLRAVANVSNDLMVHTTGGTNSWARFVIKTNNAGWILGSSQNFGGDQFYLIDALTAQSRLTIQPNGGAVAFPFGNVGIGTTNPQAGLEVNRFPNLRLRDFFGGSKVFDLFVSGGYFYVFDVNAGSGRLGITPEGHLIQPAHNNGSVKAMVYVNAISAEGASIVRCYNGVTGSSSGNCGFVLTTPLGNFAGVYRLNLGFPVSGRFVAITCEYNRGSFPNSFHAGANFRFFDNTSIEVFTFSVDDSQDTIHSSFMLIVY